MDRRQVILQWRERLRATPHYLDRMAAGTLGGRGLLNAEEQQQIGELVAAMAPKRRERENLRKPAPRSKVSDWHPVKRYHRGVLWGRREVRIVRPRVAYTLTRGEHPDRCRVRCPQGDRRYAIREGARTKILSRRTHAYRRSRGCWTISAQGMVGYAYVLGRLTREAVARAIAKQRSTEYARHARLPDGGLWGVRAFQYYPEPYVPKTFDGAPLGVEPRDEQRGVLLSPKRGTPWPHPAQRAHKWSDSAACRGECGLHALWRPRSMRYLVHTFRELVEKYVITPDKYTVFAIVGGYGRAVIGDDGFRSEAQVIQAIYAPNALCGELAAKYREVPVYSLEECAQAAQLHIPPTPQRQTVLPWLV